MAMLLNKKMVIVGTILGVIGIGSVVILNTCAQPSNEPIPQHIMQSTNFSIYYPQTLPQGMSLDGQSFSSTSQVLTFSLTYDKTKKLIVSEQPLTDKDIINSFNPTKQFTTTIGTAYVVEMNDRVTAAVVADQSWLILNAPEKISIDMMEQFINNLRLVNKNS